MSTAAERRANKKKKKEAGMQLVRWFDYQLWRLYVSEYLYRHGITPHDEEFVVNAMYLSFVDL